MPVKNQPQADRQKSLTSDSALSDARLVDAVRRGDRDAFGELVKRYERRLLGVIRRFVERLDTAEDLTQETFIRAYQKLDQFDPCRRFGPWLFQIGVNLSRDHHRKQKRRVWARFFSEGSEERPYDPGTSDPRETEDLNQEVQAVLHQIPEKYRTVLILRDLENFSTSDIAAILKRKETTIRWRLAEARNRFREHWERRLNAVDSTSH